MNVFESAGTEMLRKANALNADKERGADALVRISADFHILRKELAAERERAEKAEAANKRYSLYIAVISGINSDVTYSDSGFKIYSFSKDDVYAYYATQVINDTYYEVKATSKHYKYYLSDSDKELKEYFDDICEIINSIKPA